MWSTLPATVPAHFGISGRPDAYGGKTTLLLMPAIALVLTVLLLIVARLPWAFNYPVRITPENAARTYRTGRLVPRWINLVLVWTFAVIGWQSIQVAQHSALRLPGWYGPVLLAFALLLPVAVLALIVVLSGRQ
ncbi:MAG: DUF1648 domain-containing protein [Ktedonobacterales bacterium]